MPTPGPVPYPSKLLDAAGLVFGVWAAWFRDLLTDVQEIRSDADDLLEESERYTTGYHSSDNQTTLDTASNVTGYAIAVAANARVAFDMFLQTTCNNTGGIKYALVMPSGATFRAIAHGSNSSGGTIRLEVMSTSGALNSSGFNNFNGSSWLRLAGTLINGANAGTIQLQFASGTAGQTSTILKESFWRAVVL